MWLLFSCALFSQLPDSLTQQKFHTRLHGMCTVGWVSRLGRPCPASAITGKLLKIFTLHSEGSCCHAIENPGSPVPFTQGIWALECPPCF